MGESLQRKAGGAARRAAKVSIVRRSSGLRTCAGLSRGVRPTAEPLVAGWLVAQSAGFLGWGRGGGVGG
ncbi:hypothetical protein CEE59_09420, partial [Stenotrophomonas maltophilia]